MTAPISASGRQAQDRQPTTGPRSTGQSRLSGVEAAANVLFCMALSLALQVLLFPLIGVVASARQYLSLLATFTGLSFLRVYVLRRLFERRRRSAR